MTGFSPEWLALREPLDAASRAHVLADDLRRALSGNEPIRILDLATGTGANLRYLAPRLGGRQEWLLVDDDPALLDALPSAMQHWAGDRGFRFEENLLAIEDDQFVAEMRSIKADLAKDLDRLPFGDCHLVTASALLDLVSEPWLKTCVSQCRRYGAAILFSLTYDGWIEFDREEPEDQEVRELVNRHQLSDKGFGPALGPAAVGAAARLCASLGYRVVTEKSDWHLKPAERGIQQALLAGWIDAAKEIAPDAAARLTGWQRRRVDVVASSRSRLIVGHRDLLAYPDPTGTGTTRNFAFPDRKSTLDPGERNRGSAG